ncbi:hypothetical protein BST61_g9980 [Cercospora zeina]
MAASTHLGPAPDEEPEEESLPPEQTLRHPITQTARHYTTTRTSEPRVIFEDIGTHWRFGQAMSELNAMIQAVQEQVRDAIDTRVARERWRLHRDDANSILHAFNG